MSTGIVVFAHGSRIESANEAVRSVAADLARQAGSRIPNQEARSHEEPLAVEAAFLELGQPDLEGAVLRLAARGLRRIVVIPYFLTLGTHLERDLPAIVKRISSQNNGLELVVTPPLDGHPALLAILLDRAATFLPKT